MDIIDAARISNVVHNMQDKIEGQKHEINILTDKCNTLSAELDKAHAFSTELNRRFNGTSFQQAELEKLRAEFTHLVKENNSLYEKSEEVEKLRAEIYDLADENSNLANQQADNEELRAEVTRLADEKRSVDRQLNESKLLIEQLKHTVSMRPSFYDDLQIAGQKIARLEKEKVDLSDQLHSWRTWWSSTMRPRLDGMLNAVWDSATKLQDQLDLFDDNDAPYDEDESLIDDEEIPGDSLL
jgi:DNA repair exonuclease SbcCD ATPase subunit